MIKTFEIFEDAQGITLPPKKGRKTKKQKLNTNIDGLTHDEACALFGWPIDAVKQGNQASAKPTKEGKTPFKMRCRFVLVTWSRCDIPPANFVSELRKKNIFPDRYIACQEQHKDLKGKADENYRDLLRKDKAINTKDKRKDTKHIHVRK